MKKKISKRERQVLELFAGGLTFKEVAERLGIGVETVRTHGKNIRTKMAVRTRIEAVVASLADSNYQVQTKGDDSVRAI